MKGFVLFLVLGWTILILQSTVISYITPGLVQPELLLLILVHIGMQRRGLEGGGLAVCYGYLMDLFSGYVFGTYLLLYLCLFVAARLLSVRFLFQSRPLKVLLIFGFSVAGQLSLVALASLAAGPAGPDMTPSGVMVQALVNVGSALLLFPLLERLERVFSRREGMLEF